MNNPRYNAKTTKRKPKFSDLHNDSASVQLPKRTEKKNIYSNSLVSENEKAFRTLRHTRIRVFDDINEISETKSQIAATEELDNNSNNKKLDQNYTSQFLSRKVAHGKKKHNQSKVPWLLIISTLGLVIFTIYAYFRKT